MRDQGLSLKWVFGLLLLYAVLIALPQVLSFSQKEIAVFLVINVLLVVSYRLLTLTGEWSLGHVVIMGVGAYASALATKRLGVPVPISMPPALALPHPRCGKSFHRLLPRCPA